MPDPFHIISYYTGDGTYAAYAATLRASCEKFAIPHTIVQLPSAGDWMKNANRKPAFMYDHLTRLKCPVVWCDCDCEIIQFPDLFRGPGVDLMIYNWLDDPGNGYPDQEPSRLIAASGVVYAAYTPPALQFIHRWSRDCAAKPGIIDDQVINQTFNLHRPKGLRHRWLPRTYNRMDGKFPDTPPIINHVFTSGGGFAREAP